MAAITGFDGFVDSDTDSSDADTNVIVMKGRPKVAIDKERLQYLRSLKFTWEEIGKLMGASSKTVQRRAKEWNIKTFSVISNDELDHIISELVSQFPHYGEVMIRGHLHSQKVSIVDQIILSIIIIINCLELIS